MLQINTVTSSISSGTGASLQSTNGYSLDDLDSLIQQNHNGQTTKVATTIPEAITEYCGDDTSEVIRREVVRQYLVFFSVL